MTAEKRTSPFIRKTEQIISAAGHIWRESRIGWFDTIDALPRHERERPEVAARKALAAQS